VMAGVAAFTTLCVALLPGRMTSAVPAALTAATASQR